MKTFHYLVLCVASSAALVGCPVDDRKLTGGGGAATTAGASTGGSAGQSHAGVTHGGGSGTGGGQPEGATSTGGTPHGEGGAGGAGPPYPPLVDGCVDLDVDGVADCTQNLLDNADFKLTTDDWKADPGAAFSWNETNAYADDPSGSARVAAVGASMMPGLVLASASQCQPMAPGTDLDIIAPVFIASGQGEGLGGISIFFFDQADCMGSIKDSFDSSGATTDAWFTLRGKHHVAEGVASMRVRLTASKPYTSESFEASFDNILVRQR